MHGLDTKTSGIPWATPYSHRPVQKLLARIGNPRSSQQLMGQLPIFGCLRQKSSMISRARAAVKFFSARAGHKNIRYTVRYTVLSPTGSETSGTVRQCGIVAATNGPIAPFFFGL